MPFRNTPNFSATIKPTNKINNFIPFKPHCFLNLILSIKYFLLLSAFLLSNISFAQNELLDSLYKELKNAKEDTTKIKLRYEIGEEARIFRISYWDSLRVDSEKENFKKYEAKAINNLGYIYDNEGDISKALRCYQKSIRIQREIVDMEGIAVGLNNIGYIYDNQGNIPKALDYFHLSLKIRQQIGDEKGVATCFNNIGSIYMNQGDLEKGEDYFQSSLVIRKSIDDQPGIAYSLNNLGSVYEKKATIALAEKKHEANLLLSTAMNFYEQSFAIKEKIGDKIGAGVSLNNIASIFEKKGDLDSALNYYQKSLSYNEAGGSKTGIIAALNNIGKLYWKLKKIKAAEEYCKKSLEMAQDYGYPAHIRNASAALYEMYKEQNNGMMALVYHEIYIAMRDSINNSETQKAALKKQINFEFEQRELKIKTDREKKDAIAEKDKQTQKIIKYSISGILIVTIIFSLFLFNRFRFIQSQKKLIEQQKVLVEEKQKEILDSINYAERLQRSLMASSKLLDENLQNYFTYFNPKEAVSGDFYWASKLSNNKFALVCADSTGHGVPGAIMSMMNMNSLKEIVKEGFTESNEILNETRRSIIETLANDGSAEGGKDGMDTALIVFNEDKTQLEFSLANNPLWLIRNNQLIEYKPDKMPVGKHDKQNIPFTKNILDLQKEDMVYIFTDGYADQFGGEKGKKFKNSSLKELLLSIHTKPTDEQKMILVVTFENWRGRLEQVDDVCVIGVRI